MLGEYSHLRVCRIRRQQRLGRVMTEVEGEWGQGSVRVRWPSLTVYDVRSLGKHVRKGPLTPG